MQTINLIIGLTALAINTLTYSAQSNQMDTEPLSIHPAISSSSTGSMTSSSSSIAIDPNIPTVLRHILDETFPFSSNVDNVGYASWLPSLRERGLGELVAEYAADLDVMTQALGIINTRLSPIYYLLKDGLVYSTAPIPATMIYTESRGAAIHALAEAPDGHRIALGTDRVHIISSDPFINMSTPPTVLVPASVEIDPSDTEDDMEEDAMEMGSDSAEITAIAFHPTDTIIALGTDSGLVEIRNFATGTLIRTIGEVDGGEAQIIRALMFNHDGTELAIGNGEGELLTYNLVAEEAGTLRIAHEESACASMALSNNLRTVVMGSVQYKDHYEDHPADIRIFATEGLTPNTPTHTLLGHTGSIWCLDISPDETLIASGADDNTVRIWHSETGNILHTITLNAPIKSIAFNRTSKLIAISSEGSPSNIELWDAHMGRKIAQLTAGSSQINKLCFSKVDDVLIGGDKHGRVYLWRIDPLNKIPLGNHEIILAAERLLSQRKNKRGGEVLEGESKRSKAEEQEKKESEMKIS